MSGGERERMADALELTPEPLTAQVFMPFGEVVEAGPGEAINDGTALRRDLAAAPDVAAEGGTVRIGVVRTRPRPLPLLASRLERHPLGSQAFVPITARRFLVVVAAARGDGAGAPQSADVRAFVAGPGQGVHYRRGVWHHALTALEAWSGGDADFLVVDRAGPGENLEEADLERPCLIRPPAG